MVSAWQGRAALIQLHVLLHKSKFYQNHAKTKVLEKLTTLTHTFFGGFAAEKVSGVKGTSFTSLSSHCTRLKTSSSEISSSEYRDESIVP